MKNFMDVSGNFKVRYAETPSGGSTTFDTSSASWTQLGSDIDGEAAGDEFGYSVSLSNDGTIIAIGAVRNDGTGSNVGHVRVYQYANSSWTQIGQDIHGERAEDFSGWSVSLSSDGTIVAIGAPLNDAMVSSSGHVRVYQYANSTWTQLGSDIDGATTYDNFGYDVSLSSDGSIMAIGVYSYDSNGLPNSGLVQVYQYANSTWTQLGNDMLGEIDRGHFGKVVSLSSDGTIVAIGESQQGAGKAKVYQYANSTWTQLGDDIIGEATSDYLGSSVSLSSDGTILAVGARYNDGGGSNSGHVRVYQYANSTWTQLGQDIDGEAADDWSGEIGTVSLSSDGTIVAIGAYKNDGNGTDSGHVRVFQYVNSTWTQAGSDIDGEAAGDQSGFSVSLSGDGSIVAIGARYNDGTGANAGHVRVYDGGFSVAVPSITVLDVSGNVNMLSGTTNVSLGVVDISGTTWMNRGQSGGTIADAYQKGLVIESNSSSSSDAVLYIETAGQAQAFSVRGDGAVYADNALSHSSDDRRKINEQYITNATETLKKLSPQIYTKLNAFVANGGTPTKTESGLIAQEIYYNAPELRHLVYTEGTPQPYDLSGTTIQNDPDYTALGWGDKTAYVNYIGLIPYIIKSNQEQQEIIDNKQQQIADNKKALEEDIESRIAALET